MSKYIAETVWGIPFMFDYEHWEKPTYEYINKLLILNNIMIEDLLKDEN